jgi:hypothetical protein
MLHNEHFDKADRSWEVRHDDNGNAIHVLYKDGEAIVFPTAYDLARYHFTGDSSIERFYLDEDQLGELYECKKYDYYSVKNYWNEKHPN